MMRIGQSAKLALLATILAACMESPDQSNAAPQLKLESTGFRSPPGKAGDASRYKAITEPGVPIGLGFGVDVENEAGIPSRCLEGKVESIPQQEGAFFISGDFSKEELNRVIGVSGGGGINLGKWGLSSRGQFAHKTHQEQFGLNYIAVAINKDHSKVFIPDQRSEAMKHLSTEEFITRCGSGYVAAQDFGSLLIVRFSLRLSNRSGDNSFGNTTSGSFMSFAKLRASISANQGTKGVSGSLSMSALQVGGKPSELGKLLKTSSEKGIIETFPLCDVKEVEKCLAGLRSIEEYLSETFPKQIADKENGGSAVLATYPFLYPKTMGPDYNPGLDEYVLKARKELSRLYEVEMSDIAMINQFASASDQGAKEIVEKATANVAAIREATQLCYDPATYQQCAMRAEEIGIACTETNVPANMTSEGGAASNQGSSSGE